MTIRLSLLRRRRGRGGGRGDGLERSSSSRKSRGKRTPRAFISKCSKIITFLGEYNTPFYETKFQSYSLLDKARWDGRRKRINDTLKHCTEFNASLQQDSPRRRTPILLVETKPIQSRSRKCDHFRSKSRASTKQPLPRVHPPLFRLSKQRLCVNASAKPSSPQLIFYI